MAGSRTAEEEAAWQAVRRVVLRRDGQRCVECGADDPGELDVHHLLPRHAGGQDVPSNCVTLCDACHAARHMNLQVSLSRRMMQRWALRLARWVDRRRELPSETAALADAMRLFGVTEFRDGQLDAVLAALRGESVLVVGRTGWGKSLCFQLPAVLAGQPHTVVLSPLRALMSDQVESLHRKRIPATFINGDLGRDEKQQRYELLDQGVYSLLYVAPERFDRTRVRPNEVARLTRRTARFMVVDEAHLVDRWGEAFRVSYARLAEVRRELGEPPVLAYTATAGVRTQERIKQSLGIPHARTLITGVDRPNIALVRLRESSDAARADIVAGLLRNLSSGRLMLFVPTAKVGREVQQLMARAGFELPFFHGQLPAPEREHITGRFKGTLDPPTQAVICTSAFSMGMDISDVRVVVHWQHQASVEDFLQTFGRAGRDGQPALSLLFTAGGREAGLLRFMAEKTSEGSVAANQRTRAQAAAALQGMNERITEMGSLAALQGRCFREALNEALMGPPAKRRRSLAVRLLGWAFSRESPVATAEGCCDHCDSDLASRVRAGEYAGAATTSKTSKAGPESAKHPARTRRREWTVARRNTARIAAAVTLAAVAAAAAVVATDGGDDRASARTADVPPAHARVIFERYTAAFAKPGEFGAPSMRRVDGQPVVCGAHRRRGTAEPGRYHLCVLVDPDGAGRVIGGYKTGAAQTRARDCYGAAERLPLCAKNP